MKILFMGTPDIAAESLEALISAGHEICAVFTRRDKPVGRKQILTAPPVKQMAEKHGIPLIIPPLSLCGDNAVMIAKAGWHMAMAGRVHDLSLSAIPRGQTIPQDWKTL